MITPKKSEVFCVATKKTHHTLPHHNNGEGRDTTSRKSHFIVITGEFKDFREVVFAKKM